MIKRKLETSEIEPMIRQCYESDPDLINKFHVISGSGLDNCIKRTVSDFINLDVTIYALEKDNKFLGYFGEESFNQEKWLTGFFIMPEFRKNKTEFWNSVKSHFNNSFNIGLFTKNKRAKRFLETNGCEITGIVMTKDGIGEMYTYKEVV